MRVATEMDFEIAPDDELDFVANTVRDSLSKVRELGGEKGLALKVFMDVEIR